METLPDVAPEEARHPIAVVAERTGISQDLLRVWERRYEAVRPTRDGTGQRQYTDADIRRLGLLQAATRAGRSIGQVARLSTEALAALVETDRAARRERRAQEPLGSPQEIDAALTLARALDASALDDMLRRSAAAMGLWAFVERVVTPLLHAVGDEWHAGRLTPAQEHLVSATLHDIVTGMMRAFPRQAGAPKLLVATPAGERHAIGAALVGAAAALEGWNVLHLGADLPASEIADAARAAGVRAVALSLVFVADRERTLEELRTLRARLPAGVTVIAGGAAARSLAGELAGMDVHVETSVAGLVDALRRVPDDAQSAAR